MQKSKKKFIFTILILFVGIIIVLSVVYHQTSLWKPEQSLITLLPESPICYFTLKDLEGLVKTFNHSEFGKQVKQMPILKQIKTTLWWRQIVYQKTLWEYEMGGRLDMGAVNGHFGKEVILALYQRDGELSFLLITEVGGAEKLAIEAVTATDAINPNYERIKTEYNGLTINTIIGYPLDFSYTFIGKIGVLTLNPLLLAEVIDIYAEEKDGFLAKHPIKKQIQESCNNNTNTGYVDVPLFSVMLNELANENSLITGHLPSMTNNGEYWTLGNRYEEGVIISVLGFGKHKSPTRRESKSEYEPTSLPEQTALVTYNPQHNWHKFWELLNSIIAIEYDSDIINLSDNFKPELTAALLSHNDGETSKFPSLVLQMGIQNRKGLEENIKLLNNSTISAVGTPLEFLEVQVYRGISIQPIRIRLNFLLAITGGFAIINNNLFFSTTLSGLKVVIDANSENSPKLENLEFVSNGIQTHIRPNLLIPEIKRLIPIATLLASFSGMKLDAQLMQHLQANLFPLESLGPITANVNVGDDGTEAEVRIVLDE